MDLVILAEAGSQTEEWTATARNAGADHVRAVSDWAALMSALVAGKPGAVLLDYSTLAGDGHAALTAADMTLRALAVPAIVVLAPGEGVIRHKLELETEFEHFLDAPLDAAELRQTLGIAARLMTRASRSATGAPPAVGTVPGRSLAPSASDSGPGFLRTPTSPGTPMSGVPVVDATGAVRPPTSAEATGQARPDRATVEVDVVPDDAPPRPPTAAATPRDAEATPLGAAATPLDDEPTPLDAETLRAIANTPAPDPAATVERPPVDDDEAATEEIDVDALVAELSGARSGATPIAPAEPAADATFRADDPLSDSAAHSPVTSDAARSASASGAARVATPSDSAAHAAYRADAGGSRSGAVKAISIGDTGEQMPVLTLTLPEPRGGSLSDVAVPQVLFMLAVARATGELTLETASLKRTIILFEGEPGMLRQEASAEDEKKFLSSFGWTTGSYAFEALTIPEATFFTFGEPMELIFRGIQRNYGLNETAAALGPFMRKYPVQTNQLPRYARVLGLEGLTSFASLADGSTTLEMVMVAGGGDPERLLHLGYFAWLSGCIVFTDAPTKGPIPVTFETPRLAPAGPRAAESAQGNGVSEAEADARRIANAAKRARARENAGSAADRETYERLNSTWDFVSTRSPYEVFELEPGCGVDKVNARFYELVRQYHPDRYARIQNQQIRRLAEKIFLQIRSLHTELTQREREGGTGAATISHQGSKSDMGTARRNRRNKPRSGSGGGIGTVPTNAPPVGPPGQANKVGDVLNRLRTRGAAGDSGAQSSVKSRTSSTGNFSGVRRMAPDQLMRNAREATERGNFRKGLELVTLARARGATGPISDAYLAFLQYTQQEVSAAEAIDAIDGMIDDIANEVDKSSALTLAGHACRLEELNKESIDYYGRAVKEWPDNESAARWLRHLRRREAEDEKKKPFSSSFLNKIFTSKPK